MRLNTKPTSNLKTHEGAPAKAIDAEAALRRSVLSCLLWESEFYEDGQKIADRIVSLAENCSPTLVANLAIDARGRYNLRHVPLLLLTVLAKTGAGTSLVSETVQATIQRADELAEFVAIYWRDGRQPLSAQMKKGLAAAFGNFDSYQLSKYDRANAVKLRDVLRLVHPTPTNEEQSALWKQLTDGTLSPPDTWEVNLSAGADKRETFERLLSEGKLGYLALLRNLRNMTNAGVDISLIRKALLARKGAHRVLPFRYIAAARAVPQLEPEIDRALQESIAEMPALPGRTVVLVDVSASMNDRLSHRSDLTRMDAAAALSSVINGDLRVFSFSNRGDTRWGRSNYDRVLVEVPPRRGMAGVEAVINSQEHSGTLLGKAVHEANAIEHDRLIVITDEQSADRVPDPIAKRAYMINVASAQNGIGYRRWTHIDGFSEQVLRYILELENFGYLDG